MTTTAIPMTTNALETTDERVARFALTVRERRFVAALLAGRTNDAALAAAGYRCTPGASASAMARKLRSRLRELEAEASAARAALVALPERATVLPTADEVLARVRALGELLEGADVAAAREVLRGVVDVVKVTPRGSVAEVRAGLLPAALVGTAGRRGDVSIAGTRTTHLATLGRIEAVGEIRVAGRAVA